MARTASAPRGITGRTVFLAMLAFFTVVAGVNAVMISVAMRSFSGTVTDSSYKAGIRFGSEQRAAMAQRALGWRVEPVVTTLAGADRSVVVTAVDAAGKPLGGLAPHLTLRHPADARRDVAVALVDEGAGRYAGDAVVPPGQWDLVLELDGGDESPYHLEHRLVLP
jgi:nitrogen fixation protein FixH